ncbi:helix-turn-helix transcriptional regulator [Streptomyces sp. BE303]|uniref:helix-turn-helix transcriptional regulator n=1 Tax=Streptomyces sp. BE303 TaxID=3002528 RepID=UPI002E79B136|nr:AAA family ATPase [Streptomyces sp. BE303]MED7951332.1 AAA family ATPase [Streptomyces sp. BE303]
MPTFPAPRDPSRSLPVGREPEYRRLRDAFDRCAAGAGSVIVLHGSVGSGRSDLLYAFTDTAAERGAHVLVGTGSPLEREFPLGLARQLLQGADLEPEEAAAAESLLAQGAAEGARPVLPDGPQGQLTQRTLEGLFRLVRRLAERAPVLIAVDDRQDADPQSLEFLLYLVRRTRSAGVLTVLSSRETMTPSNPFFEVELARQPHHQHIRLDLLSADLVAELLRARLGAASARLAVEAHALTGGNPLLVHSLIGDQETAGVPDELVVGEGYRRGLMHCLHRIDPLALHYARGVAVLGASATPDLLAELLLLAPDSLPRALYLLHAAGLFRDGGFRHPTAAGDLLAAMRPVELAALHQRAGRLLRAAGAADATVHGHARVAEGHLRSSLSAAGSASGEVPGPGAGTGGGAGTGAGTYGWPPGLDGTGGAGPVGGVGGAGSTGGFGATPSAVGSVAASTLGSAAGFGGAWTADDAGPVGGTEGGLSGWLSGDLSGSLSGHLRGDLRADLHRDPHGHPSGGPTGGPIRGVAGRADGLHSTGGFGPEAGHGPVVGVLGSFGTAAVECVPTLPGTVTDAAAARRHELKVVRHHFWHGRTEQGVAALARFEAEPGNAAPAEALRHWLAYWYPGLLPNPARPQPGRPTTADHRGDGMRLLAALLAGTVAPETAVVQAELILRAGRLGGVRTESLTAALTVLLYADRADRAAHWCGPLAERAGARCGANWHALLAALRAEAALRQGDLRAADEAGRAAFAHVRPEAWGVAAGLPLATMAAARTAAGLHQDAAHFLELPTPEGMARTPAGLHHRFALAGHRLALGRAEEALADYRACGDAMARWGLDHLPAIAPWRLGAARAYLALGHRPTAAALADQQLARLGPAGHPRVRGLALRIRAAAGERSERTELLERSVALLEEAGAEADLSATLSELSEAHRNDGDPGRARQTDRRLRRNPPLAVVPAERPAADPVGEPAAGGLSEAERRVAELAARGLSNRDIARKLYITVSTVEQHLTRVYRKLGVRRRVDLAKLVGPGTGAGGPEEGPVRALGARNRPADLVAG